jgi:sensor histidine kinase regulating citrate/malate metabolism
MLIIPAAILENFKVGYSTMRIMFLKVVFSLLSFLIAGMAFGSAVTGYHIREYQDVQGIKTITMPWYVILALGVLLLIQVAQLFSMLKAVKREFMQMDPDN